MEIDEATKKHIDYSSYEELLREWRLDKNWPDKYPGDIGKYFATSMFNKKNLCDHVAASKRVGWGE